MMSPDYDEPLFRPPAEGGNLIIQATLGCSFNRCSFCAMYRAKRYLARPLDAVCRDIDAAAHAWPEARRVFLADGDALALPTEHLLALLQKLSATLPRLTRVSCYATPSNLRRKSVAALESLRAHKLGLLYVGIESGADAILKRITKGATARTIAAALHKAHDCGMKVSGTVILGLGGTRHSAEHIDGTLELLSRAPLTQLSTLQLWLDDAVAAEFHAKYGEPFELPDDLGLLQEQARLIGALQPPRPLLFRSNHASNALPLQGTLPRERARLLAQLDEALHGRVPLRPSHLRGM